MKDACFQGLSPRLLQAMEAAVGSSPAALALVDEEFKMHVASPSLGNLVGKPWSDLLGSPYLELFPPEEQLIMSERLENPPDPEFFFPTRLQHLDGSIREVDGRCYRLNIPEERWTVVILVDVTSERRLLRKLGGISLVVSSLTYAGNLRATLDSMAQRVVETTDAVAAMVLTCENAERDDFRFSVGGSFAMPTDGLELMEATLACHKEMARFGIEFPPVKARISRQPEIFTNLRCRLDGLDMSEFPEPVRALFSISQTRIWNTVVAVPILKGTEFLGTLNCYYKACGNLESAELSFLRTLADLAGVALENARLMEEFERQVVQQERRRLARELHDSVSQALYGIALGAKTVKARWHSHPEKAQQSLDYVLELAEGAGKEMRALLYSLRPESLEEEGLVQALRRQAEALQARYGIQVDFQAAHEPELDPARRLALFRVASESLHNVVKHSGAKNVTVKLNWSPERCELEVSDDGVGFDSRNAGPDHYGLENMRERMEGIGGQWSLTSAEGHGTTIRAELDLSTSGEVQLR